MKANKFVRKHGLQYTRNLVRDYPNHTHVTDDGRMFINENTCPSHIKVQLNGLVKMDDLKRLVESHELVKDYYGLTRAKEHAESKYTAPELKAALKQAIADVESCQ